MPPCPVTGAVRQVDPHARKTYSDESRRKESSAGSPGGTGPAYHTGGTCPARGRWLPPPAPRRRRRRQWPPQRPPPPTWPCGWRGGASTACPWWAGRNGVTESSRWVQAQRSKEGRRKRARGSSQSPASAAAEKQVTASRSAPASTRASAGGGWGNGGEFEVVVETEGVALGEQGPLQQPGRGGN